MKRRIQDILYASFAPFLSPLVEIVRESMPHLTRAANGFMYPSRAENNHPVFNKKGKKKRSFDHKKQ